MYKCHSPYDEAELEPQNVVMPDHAKHRPVVGLLSINPHSRPGTPDEAMFNDAGVQRWLA